MGLISSLLEMLFSEDEALVAATMRREKRKRLVLAATSVRNKQVLCETLAWEDGMLFPPIEDEGQGEREAVEELEMGRTVPEMRVHVMGREMQTWEVKDWEEIDISSEDSSDGILLFVFDLMEETMERPLELFRRCAAELSEKVPIMLLFINSRYPVARSDGEGEGEEEESQADKDIRALEEKTVSSFIEQVTSTVDRNRIFSYKIGALKKVTDLNDAILTKLNGVATPEVLEAAGFM